VNPEEKKKQLYKKILSVGAEAVLVKLCDRQSNIRACIAYKKKRKFQNYHKSYPEFKEALSVIDSPETDKVWELLAAAIEAGEALFKD
jgi:hypothetical protein